MPATGGATAKVSIDLAVSGGVEFGLKASGASVWPVGKGAYLDDPSGSATMLPAKLLELPLVTSETLEPQRIAP